MFLICPFFLLPACEVTKRCEVTKKVRKGYKRLRNKLPSYEKGTKLRKIYEVTKRYEVTKKVRRGHEISYERPW